MIGERENKPRVSTSCALCNLPILGHFLGALQKTGPLGYHETNIAQLAADSGTADLLLADRGPLIQIFASETFLNVL